MTVFDHEKLDVYNASVEFVALADGVLTQPPRGRSHLADQLHRAAVSIALNIAEGAGEFATAEKERFYRMAKRSATECAAILHVCTRLELIESTRYEACRSVLLRIVAMLVRMAGRSRDDAGAGLADRHDAPGEQGRLPSSEFTHDDA